MTDRPAPPVPVDCDLRGMPFMPLDLVRVFDSDLYAMSTGEEFKAAFTLWGKSFLQVPAASLPTDDRILAHLSGVGAKRWPKVKDMALRGFVLASDDRLYHPIVAEKALEAWAARVGHRARTEAARAAALAAKAAKAAKEPPHPPATPPATTPVAGSVTDEKSSVTEPKGQGQGQGQGQGILSEGVREADEHDLAAPPPLTAPAADADRWAYVRTEAWARNLVAAGCKIGAGSWSAWKALTDRWPVARVIEIAATVPATERFSGQVEEALRRSGGQKPISTAINPKNVHRIDL